MFFTIQPRFRPWSEADLAQHAWRSSVKGLDDFISKNSVLNRQGPAFNLSEDNESFLLEVELPGQSMEDVEVEIHGKKVTLSGKRSTASAESPKNEGMRMLLREHWTGDYSRTVHLPEAVDAGGVTRDFHAGLLRLRLPKKNQTGSVRLRLQDIPHDHAA